ncbi:MAG: UDP-N-acetylmuramoyl-L-alanine--D-glutamate ligase [Treponema sp.]|nr:UDP-N-acetylmuramoyl-L-alanine--D-glutamate ligase [Treponema sp.]
MKALVMGLGLHGGGLESARFLLKKGADVMVTDLRDEITLMPAIEQLDRICSELGSKPVRYVLGRHKTEDFKNADIVIKNPGVRQDSPFLEVSKKIETDISLFLKYSRARLFAVTGTKGKSSTASALHRILASERKKGKAFLGGNITVSPLTFLDELTESDDVVLELSSFQLGDIKNYTVSDGSKLLKPKAAVLTPVMHDHLDRYSSMDDYIDDKRNIYRGQDSSCITVAGDDRWGKSFLGETKGRPLVCSYARLDKGTGGGWINTDGTGIARLFADTETVELVPQRLLTPGKHQRFNMLSAALAAYGLGAEPVVIRGALASFTGIEHRLEHFHEADKIHYYNDSAATIPEAAAACIEALSGNTPLVLVTGGTDKNLDFSPLSKAAGKAKDIILLSGTGSEKLESLLDENMVSYKGPFNDLEKAVQCAIESAENNMRREGSCNVALSPGCASFGMFLNEFDRGRKWKEAVLRNT